ncbi:protein of unknown function [Acidithiobacillus ferrivorans]|uniref:Uncharacterized protein n=1 Tax=Acidithiobacillus ferrivorans TaxID=160808 RepID=A0A060UZQ0_9PROT|nr:hypothetical protein [Acidithiobacillus ferrivorans]CDQ12128.1 hypothetical protein AFERRI_80077 [Acidithiobacillus ferrivorans]SMH64744.1 protein of unknown function [Acidithiobacillus ferrivorans]
MSPQTNISDRVAQHLPPIYNQKILPLPVIRKTFLRQSVRPVSINLNGDALGDQREIDPDPPTVKRTMFSLYLGPFISEQPAKLLCMW